MELFIFVGILYMMYDTFFEEDEKFV